MGAGLLTIGALFSSRVLCAPLAWTEVQVAARRAGLELSKRQVMRALKDIAGVNAKNRQGGGKAAGPVAHATATLAQLRMGLAKWQAELEEDEARENGGAGKGKGNAAAEMTEMADAAAAVSDGGDDSGGGGDGSDGGGGGDADRAT